MRAPGLALALLPALALAQVVPERELEIVKATYEVGNYAECLKRARDAMGVTNFTDPQRVQLHKYAGMSAFNLGQPAEAQKSFLQLLQLNPDFVLDPFAVPPPAIKLFEQVKKDNADQLNLIRQQIALRAEQDKRLQAERERQQKDDEERRRRLEELSRGVTVRTVERRPLVVNFLPFGAGQFQEGRPVWGGIFAATEGALLVASVVSYFAFKGLLDVGVPYKWTDRVTADNSGLFQINVTGIPLARANEAQVWRILNIAGGFGFIGVWALGVVDALVNHQGDQVTETREAPAPARPPAPKVQLFLAPGAGAGLRVQF